jgi:hypothetical protein
MSMKFSLYRNSAINLMCIDTGKRRTASRTKLTPAPTAISRSAAHHSYTSTHWSTPVRESITASTVTRPSNSCHICSSTHEFIQVCTRSF